MRERETSGYSALISLVRSDYNLIFSHFRKATYHKQFASNRETLTADSAAGISLVSLSINFRLGNLQRLVILQK